MDKSDKLVRILSIDGGGIKGIIPGQVLIRLEEKLKLIAGSDDARIADYFDLIAGTSTGGILTCLYLCPDEHGKPKYSARDAVRLYLEHGKNIFHRSIGQRFRSIFGLFNEKFSAAALESAISRYIEELKLSELLKPCLITSYDITSRHAHFFTQHDAAQKPSHNFKVADVARATSAAPSYFEAAHVKSETNETFTLVDGGIFANNPSLCAYAEARTLDFGNNRLKPKAADMLILSLGTGKFEKKYLFKKARKWGLIGWLRPVIDIMMSGVAETVDYQLHKIYDAVGRPQHYLRIEPTLCSDMDMDEATDETLEYLRIEGEKCADENDAELERFARLLVQE